MTPDQERLLKSVERKLTRLLNLIDKENGIITCGKTTWGSHEDACKILKRSKHWYQMRRNFGNPKLLMNEWRKVGGRVEYLLTGVERLKERLIGH